MKYSLRFAVALVSIGVSGCVNSTRFQDSPIVWQVDDRQDIEEPESTSYSMIASAIDQFGTRRLTRALELNDRELSHNINALDEVPDSTWFTNRIGIRPVSASEAALGPSAAGPPKLPIQVTRGKPGGKNPGFVAKDALGRKFIVKFDRAAHPEMETATNVIVNRLFWTIGYNVPNDTVFYFSRGEVSVAPDAVAEDEMGRQRPMTEAELSDVLRSTAVGSDRRYRATASEFVPGTPKGGWTPEGVRDDDPNDIIPHEHRREVRGLRVFAAWVNHTDMKADNTLDTYIESGGRGYLKHYLVDFGEAFGAFSVEGKRQGNGFEHWIDYSAHPAALVSLGLWVRPWERLEQTPWPSIGRFSAEKFDPDTWHEMYPYWPFAEADITDKYWAAKLVMRFTRPLLKRIVAEGRLSRADAAEYLTDVLYERRRRIGESYLNRVTPFDYFKVRRSRICGVDLSVRYGIVTGGLVEVLNDTDEVAFAQLVDEDGRFCIPIHDDDEYRIYRMRVKRSSTVYPVMRVHFKGGERARLLGIERLES